MANKKFEKLTDQLIFDLSLKFDNDIASLIVPDIADYLLSDYMNYEAARKFLNKSGSRQQQPAQLAADQSSSSGEPTLKKQKTQH